MNEYREGLWPFEGGIIDEEERTYRIQEPPREPQSRENLVAKVDSSRFPDRERIISN